MSFTTDIKQELIEVNTSKLCCKKAELCSIICFGAHIRDNCLILRTENIAFANHISRLCVSIFKKPAVIIKKATPGLYEVQIANQSSLKLVLNKFELVKNAHDMKNFVSFHIPAEMLDKQCCKKAILRGAFLTAGSCAEPEKRYHLEISTNHFMLIRELLKIMEEYDIFGKIITRRSSSVLYLKGADHISDFLGYAGAMKAVLKLEEIRVTKDVKNNINRQTNFEYANFSKTLDAGNAQAEAIKIIKDNIGISALDENLQELAELRLNHPDISLKELGKMLSEPISKSGINHRLKKLTDIAEQIKEGKRK